ncbi:uncharacterized protein LOC129272353 isoform X1 [Lytechinus pictus]|uniref:uncharacterized protein LOC129272353 isoform X1 n=1 Tax=Lytechinus pictus TaxID=7653 RepID=UPI0030B9D2EF
MDVNSDRNEGGTGSAAEEKPGVLFDEAKSVAEGTTLSSSEETCTMDREDRGPGEENVKQTEVLEASKNGLTGDSKDTSLSHEARQELGADCSKTTKDVANALQDQESLGKEVESTKEGNKAVPLSLDDTKEGEEDPQPLQDQESCDSQQNLKDHTEANAAEEIPTNVSAESIIMNEVKDQTTPEDVPTKVTAIPLKDESADSKDEQLIHCKKEEYDLHLDETKQPEPKMSSTISSSQSANTCLTPNVTPNGQNIKQESPPSSPNLSLPSQENMQIKIDKCSSSVEDSVNNNIQKCTTSCQETIEVALSESSVLPENPTNSDQSDCTMKNGQEDKDGPLPHVPKPEENVENTQNRSMLMKYLGLQPVGESGISSKDPRVDVSSTKVSSSYLDSFCLMPGLDQINSYRNGQISYNTSPFEACSDGSHSPEPPILSETPVVGSSPPHHDYDAMEARMMDMTPRMGPVMTKGDLPTRFAQSHPPDQNTKTAFSKKQHGFLGPASSHALNSLCHRLAERVEPDVPCQDPHISQGTKLSEDFYSIPNKKQKDHDKYAAKTKKFSSLSDVVPCPRCHRTFKNRNQLRGHLRWHINDPINLLSGRWPKDRSNTHESRLSSVKTSGNILDKSGKKKKNSNIHLVPERQTSFSHLSGEAQDSFPCTLCSKVFRTSLKLRGHMMVHKRKQSKKKNIYWRNKTSKSPGSQGQFQCEICSKRFVSQTKLSAHMTTHAKEVHPRSKGVKRLGSFAHSNGENSSVDDGRTGISNMEQTVVLGKRKGPFKCSICFKTFPSLRARNGHMGIHSTKWKFGKSLHQRSSVRIKEEASDQMSSFVGPSSSETSGPTDKTGSMKTDENVDPKESNSSATANSYRVRNLYFKCIHCQLVFASRHRVRKHLMKVHSIMPPGSDSFTEERVDGCKFCEVFKKRKRGRPKRGENSLVQCPHGKIVVGYNLPLNSVRLSRKQRRTPKTVKTEEQTALTPGDVMPQKCSVKLSPVDVNAAREKDIQDNLNHEVQKSEESMLPDSQSLKKRGRPPKDRLKPAHNMQSARKIVFSVGANKRGRTRSLSSIRRRRMGKEISLLGRQLQSGWDPKRQRFIGRPYKCHLCKMSYRSERQLCGHMRSHGIHIFDLSQLPADQRGNTFMPCEDMDTKFDDGLEVDNPERDLSTDKSESQTSTPTEPDLEMTTGENGVGGICGVCKKEFDSDNMFHQHLLGRYNKKCRQEWMKHTFGFGTKNKAHHALEQDTVDDHGTVDSKDEQSSGNLYVIDKINMETFKGSGIFSNLQRNVNDKIENVLQREKLVSNCSKSLENPERRDTEQPPSVSTQSDSGLTNSFSPKKGSVLNAVINRLTQSSKPSDVVLSNTPSYSPSKPKRSRKGSQKQIFTCNICNKVFDKKQKLSVHAMIHRLKVATVMDHIENASQRNGSGISTLPIGEDQEPAQNQEVNDSLVNTESVAPMHFMYTCPDCPKQFTSNLKFTSHLKMHGKSTMSKSPKRDTSLTCSQDSKAERPPDSNKTDCSGSPLEPASNIDKLPSEEVSSATKSDISARKEHHSNESTFDLPEQPGSDDTTKTVASVQDVPIKEDLNTDREKSQAEKEKLISRPRLLLKINPTTLQRLHDCPDCLKSFKSRRHLAHHQRIHSEEKLSNSHLHGNTTPQPEICSTLSTKNVHNSPDQSELVSDSFEERTGSTEFGFQDGDQAIGIANPEPVPVENISASAKNSMEGHPPEKNVPCKICDKVMKKSQLGGHMKSHTKELLSRKFNGSDHGSAFDKKRFPSSASAKRFMDREIISGVDLYRSVSRNAEPSLAKSFTGTVHDIATIDNMDKEEAEFGSSTAIMENYVEELTERDQEKQHHTCHMCDIKFDTYQQLCQHLKMHVVKKPSFSVSTIAQEVNGVPSTNMVEKEVSFMESSKQTFARPKIYPCEICGIPFSSFRQFRVHISQTHGGKYQYRLMLQQKEAAKAGAFLKEPDTINKTHPHKCDVCGRRFKRLALLIFHLNKLHKGWKQRLCMMNVRSRPRPPQTAVQKMPGTNAPNGQTASGDPAVNPADLPFTCELCGKSFKMKVQLCGHMKTHGRVGHSPIKISPLAMKGKYTLRKSRKPDFRLSDEWILDMDDEQMKYENSMALQQIPTGQSIVDQPSNMKSPPNASMYNAPMYAAKPVASSMVGTPKVIPGLAEHSDQYRMPMSSPEMPMTPPALDLKIPVAPPPPEPSKFITIQMEPVLQQMLHRCLLCHSYFSSQENAVLHCKEVHFKKKPKAFHAADSAQIPSHPLGQDYHMSGAAPELGPHSSQHSPAVCPGRPPVSPSLQPPVPQRMHCPPPMASQISPRNQSPTPSISKMKSPGFDRMNVPPSRFQERSCNPPVHPFSGPMPKAAPTSSPSAKTISQTPFNEMLYRVEMLEGQTRYVCNTCKSTFLHYNFLMSHLAEHNHLAYTCLQCGYATYSERDYQLHCQLHDGQISKKIRRVRPKPPGYASNADKGPAPRAVATCHICQRSFVNMKGLKAHMVLHSANYSSISERRNESKKLPRNIIVPLACFNEVASEPLSLVKPTEEQTEALDLTVKPVEEALDLSMGPRSFPDPAESPDVESSIDMTVSNIPEESPTISLPDVCQVMQPLEVPEEPTPSPTPSPTGKLTHVRKPKNSIRLVGAIDVDVASLENKYSVVTDLMDTDSDISPDVPLSAGQDSPARSGEGESELDGKSPKKTRNYKCTMCQYATDFKDSMERHEQKHRKFRTLACHQCSYRTPEKRLMLRHVLTIHEKQKPYQCKLCSYSSAYKHHLKRHHTKRHQQPLLTCNLCEFTTDDVEKLKSHSASHPEPKVYQCKLCPMVFNSGKLFRAHKQIVHHKKKKSKKSSRDKHHSSSRVVESSESTTEGKETETLATSEETTEPVALKYPCNLCKYQTDDQNELTIHLMEKHFSNQIKEGLGDVCSTAQCPQCGYLTGKEQMKAHMQIHDIGEHFNCDQCLFKACTQEEVDEHVKQKHKVNLAPTLTCKMCNMRFWNAEDMKQHTEMHLKDTSISVKNPFLCNLCPLKLMNRRDALRHLQLHTDRYPFKCRHCVFSCFTKASIQRHLSIHRHANKPKSLGAIRKNGRKTHSMGASGSSGSESDVQKSQRKSHSSKFSTLGPVANRLPIYQCRFCSHNFRVAEDWQRHERRHHMIWPE